MRDDDPEDTLGDVFLSAMFGEHPVGRPVIGSVESISAMTRDQLHSFHVRRYTPDRMVVAVAGNIDHDEVVALVREHFGRHLVRGRTPVPPRKGAGRVGGRPSLQLVRRDAEQTHLSLGVRTPGRHWNHRWALSVLNSALGGGLSSRLFQQIRETRGLAYSVYSTVDTFADSGAFSVYAGCQPENLGEVTTVIREVLAKVASEGITNPDGSVFFGSPTKIFEYMAMARPIIASRLAQIGEVLEHERTALLVPPGDAQALSAALERAFTQPERVAPLGPAARAEAIRAHSWTARIEELRAGLARLGAL